MKKRILVTLMSLLLVASVGCAQQPASSSGSSDVAPVTSEAESSTAEETASAEVSASEATKTCLRLEHPDWADDVKKAANDLFDAYGKESSNYTDTAYAVFDFDNTSSIFDEEEQLAIYQLQHMAFAFTPEQLPDILITELGDSNEKRGTDYCTVDSGYADWISDIQSAYQYLFDTYGPFSAEGLDDATMKKVHEDPQWAEFATKMRAMYDLVYDSESASVAYPWVLYWFTGMTEDEVYNLALASHKFFQAVESEYVTWTSPESIDSKVGVATYEWSSGVQVTENIKELMAALKDNGIKVWICSASATDPIRAAVDAWDLHGYVDGVIAMKNKLQDGKYINQYDYENGCAWIPNEDGSWTRGTVPTKSQTQGVGKVEAVNNVLVSQYGHGPIAGFMDSTGDFNFCTEYETLKLVICFNRASRKVTDGGGLIAEVAVYQRDTLCQDFAATDAAGDTLYVLQGRDENGMRTLRSSDKTLRLGKDSEILFRDENNEAQLQYMIDNQMTVKEIIDKFAIKTSEEDSELGFKYGFLTEYAGYHSHK